MSCFCERMSGRLCIECVERVVLAPAMKAKLRAIGKRWGRSVHARAPDGVWPLWDQDTTGRLQPKARQLVTAFHMDEQVLDRLARTVAWEAGVEYRDCQRINRLRKDDAG